MNTNPVVWFEIYVNEMSRAKAFYEQMLAQQLLPLSWEGVEMLCFPMRENGTGAAGALLKMEGCPSGGNGTVVYFSCEDCAVEVARVKRLGGHVVRDKFSIGEQGFIALIVDTEGNMIGLHSMK